MFLNQPDVQAVFGGFDDRTLVGMIGIFKGAKAKQQHKAMLWGPLSMVSIDYNRQLRGFVVRDAGITQSEWLTFASTNPKFRKQPPVTGINPFTHQPMEFHNTNFLLVEEDKVVGLVVWEEAECIGVAGDGAALVPLISLLCDAFHARFEAVAS